jgi:hypothetical protein
MSSKLQYCFPDIPIAVQMVQPPAPGNRQKKGAL